MRVSYKRVGVIVGFCLLLTLLLLNAAVTRRNLSQQVGAESWVSHTQEVQLELNQLELLVVDAETGQRGYLYTGDKRYLLPYQNAISKIDPQIDSIAKLTADNPRQQAMLPELRARVHAKVEELAQVIALQQSGRPQQARDLVLTSTGLLPPEGWRFDKKDRRVVIGERLRSASFRAVAVGCVRRHRAASPPADEGVPRGFGPVASLLRFKGTKTSESPPPQPF